MRKKLPGEWALNYQQCVKCGTTSRPYFSKGQCQRCYFAEYVPANLARVKRYKRKWYRLNMTPEFQKAIREQKHYGGLREVALRRDNYTCQRCGKKRQLLVHHRDGQGRGKAAPNNRLENLETVCRACHLNIHRPEYLRIRAANGWQRSFPRKSR